VRALGIDLAWGARNVTGLCAVEADRVLDSASARTDGEIDAWIARWIAPADEAIVGIDAPLIVPNLGGRRPCEAVFCEALRERQAGVYPANLALPSFHNGIRGAALAARHGFSLDPTTCAAAPVRVALEVYPHSAMLALFGLTRTLKYKRKHARAVRAGAFAELLDGLRGLAGADPPLDVKTSPRWAALEAAVETGRGSRVEDELDAYVCAYAAVYHGRWRGRRSLVVGDGALGYIVTAVDAAMEQGLRIAAARRGVPIG
jgi:predicted RNase H-like nuclease